MSDDKYYGKAAQERDHAGQQRVGGMTRADFWVLFKEGLPEQVIFEQRPEEGEANCGYLREWHSKLGVDKRCL